MSLDYVYYPHAILLPGVTNNVIQLESVSPSFNSQARIRSCASGLSPRWVGTESVDPSISFTTTQIKTVLDACTSSGLYRDFTAGNVDVIYRAAGNFSEREADGTAQHIIVRLQESSMMFWKTINATQGSDATISCELVTSYNSSNQSMTILPLQTISAISCEMTEQYSLGPQVVNSTVMRAKSFTWDNQVELERQPTNSELNNTFVGIKGYAPKITIGHLDNAGISFSGAGAGVAVSSLACYLRAKNRTTINYADASTNHIKLNGFAGLIHYTSMDGSPIEPQIDINLEVPTAASGNPLFSFDTAIAIT